MQSIGRIVVVDFTLPRVCPNKRVASAVILTELNSEGNEHKRGIKTLTVPAHTQSSCRDVLVGCVKFVLSEAFNVADTTDMCEERNLRVKIIAHYIAMILSVAHLKNYFH